MYKAVTWWEPTVELRELYWALCGDLNGKEIQKRGDDLEGWDEGVGGRL